LKQHLSWQQCEINRLNKDYKQKNISIEDLNSEKAVELTEAKEVETLNGQAISFSNKSCEKGSEAIQQELARVRFENLDVIRLQAKLCQLELNQSEFKRVKEENMSQRHEIASLERRLQTLDDGSGICSACPSGDRNPCAESSSSSILGGEDAASSDLAEAAPLPTDGQNVICCN